MERIFSDMCSGGTYIPRDIRSPKHISMERILTLHGTGDACNRAFNRCQEATRDVAGGPSDAS